MSWKSYYLDVEKISLDPKLGIKDYSLLYQNGIKIKEILKNKNFVTDIKSGRTPDRFNKDYWDYEGNEFLTMQDIETDIFRLNGKCSNFITDYAVETEKTLFLSRKNSVIFSNAMTIGLSFIVDRDIYINQNLFALSLNEEIINPKFLMWYFNLKLRPLFQNTYYSKYLSKAELSRVNIPNIAKSIQDGLVKMIEPLEEEIKTLKKQVIDEKIIINEVFAREFSFDIDLYNEFGKGMTAGTQIAKPKEVRIFQVSFADFAKSNTLRFSSRFHNEATKKLMKILSKIKTIKVSDILTEKIRRGKSPKYKEDGEIPVLKIAHLKNSYINNFFDEFVDKESYIKQSKAQSRSLDILLASTGKVSLGKIDLLEKEEEFFIDGHISIIRLNKEIYSPLFFTYFFRSILGFFQIERDFTGATNQIELYDKEISNFLIPNISLARQEKIAGEIKERIERQNVIHASIATRRNKIEEIINKAILD